MNELNTVHTYFGSFMGVFFEDIGFYKFSNLQLADRLISFLILLTLVTIYIFVDLMLKGTVSLDGLHTLTRISCKKILQRIRCSVN